MHGQLRRQHLGVHEVPAVLLRRIGQDTEAVQRRERRFLAMEVGHVREVPPLLQEVARAGEVVHPRLRERRPGFVAVEVLPENRQRQARLQVIEWLVDRRMDDWTVHTPRELQVDHGPQVCGRERPRRVR